MTVAFTLSDARVTARIRLDARDQRFDAEFKFGGEHETLRRLDSQLTRLVADESADVA